MLLATLRRGLRFQGFFKHRMHNGPEACSQPNRRGSRSYANTCKNLLCPQTPGGPWLDRRDRRCDADPWCRRELVLRQLQAPAHAELRRDPAAAAQRPEGLGRHRPAGDRRPAGQGHRPGDPRQGRGAVRAGRQAAARLVGHVAVRPRRQGADLAPTATLRSPTSRSTPSPTRSPPPQAKAFVDKITSASTDAVQFEVGGQVAQSASQAATRAACCSGSSPRQWSCSSCSGRCWRRSCRC